MTLNHFYYTIKPLIPRYLQISLRRVLAARKRRIYSNIWPVNPAAGKKPEGWKGWPDQKRFALVIQHDVDTLRGHDNCYRLMEIEKRYGIRSLYSIIPERYRVSKSLLNELHEQGFEVAAHGLRHDGKLFSSRQIFQERAVKINRYLKEWHSVGFTSPSMLRNPEWMHMLDIEYCTSTFDTDPFEPQPDGANTIFPYFVRRGNNCKGYVELPYTLPQDHLLFVILREKNIDIWKKKLDWIAEKGGMALLNSHPDYMNFDRPVFKKELYPVDFYTEFLNYVNAGYKGLYWQALPGEVAKFWRETMVV